MRRLAAATLVFVLACTPEVGAPPGPAANRSDLVTLAPAAKSLLAEGHAYYRRQAFDSARTAWLALVPSSIANRDRPLQGELYTWLGLAAWRLGEIDSAVVWESRAIGIKSALPNPHELWRSYNALGLILLDENLNDSAASVFEKAGEVASAAGDAEGVAKATGNAALAYTYLGDLERARRGHRAMRTAGRVIGDGKVEANGLANEAMVDIWEGDALSALPRLDTARRVYRATGDAVGETNALGQLATAYELMGDYGRSFAALDSALALSTKHQLAGNTVEILRLLGELHSRVGDYRRSLDIFNDAAKQARKSGADSELASILRSSAWASLRLGNSGRAMQQAMEALRLHKEAEEPLEEVDDLLLLAEIDERSGRRDAAAARLRAASERAAVAGSPGANVAVLIATAGLAERTNNPERAIALLRRLSVEPFRIPFAHASTAAWIKGRAFLRTGAVDSAIAAGAMAVDAAERARATLAATTVKSTWIADRSHIYADHIVALLRGGREEEAFGVADRGRSRALLENLAVVRNQGVSPATHDLAESERVLRRIDALIEALARTSYPQSDSRARVEVSGDAQVATSLAAARSEYERLQIRAARHPSGTGVMNVAGFDLKTLRHALDPEEAVIQYFLAPDTLFAFIVKRDGLRVARSPVNAQVLAQRVRLLKELWGAPRTDWETGLPVSRALHRELIAPVRATGMLRGVRRIVIVPHGFLAQVPFAGLQDGVTAKFLIEDFNLGQSPSVAALLTLRGLADGTRDVRVSALAPFVRELPGTLRELNAIRRATGTRSLRAGAAATEAELRRRLIGDEIVHVASHGVLNHLNPMFSRIELAVGSGTGADDNGRLEVHELLGLRVRSALVFLSGCETGSAEEWSEGLIGAAGDLTLSQAFLSAGASNVASTLWRIDDDGAAEIAGRFYSFARRMAVFDALSAAQRSVARSPGYRSPYYWAGYVISGSGRSVNRPQKSLRASVN